MHRCFIDRFGWLKKVGSCENSLHWRSKTINIFHSTALGPFVSPPHGSGSIQPHGCQMLPHATGRGQVRPPQTGSSQAPDLENRQPNSRAELVEKRKNDELAATCEYRVCRLVQLLVLVGVMFASLPQDLSRSQITVMAFSRSAEKCETRTIEGPFTLKKE